MIVADAVVGAVVAQLLSAVVNARKNTENFDQALETLQTTLETITPVVEKVKDLNKLFNLGSEEVEKLWEQIKRGHELVEKLSQINGCCICFMASGYTGRLLKLDSSLKRFCEIVMLLQQTKLMTGVHEDVKFIREELERLNSADKTTLLRPYAPPDPPEFTVGLDMQMWKLKDELFKQSVSVVVVSAPGGCGKTTLAKKLCQDEQVQGKFKDNICFVTVAKTPNLKAIIRQLFLHMGYVAPEFEDDEDAFNRLKLLLKHVAEPTLFILDNVWPGSDSLLDNFSFQLPDYKLLVTSISTFPRFDCTQKLEPLNFEDSMHLFCYSAGLQEGSSYVDEDLVTKVVKACNGFPLALKVVGRSLCRQPPAIWRNRLKEWSKSGSLFETNKEILKCLKSSFDALDDTVIKDCYMDLGSFPEGQFISATALVDIWAELYKLEEDEMTSYLHKLSTLSLVDLAFKRKHGSEIEGYYEDHFVMQHDLLRGMVNHLSNLDPIEERKRLVVDLVDRKFPDWWCQLKQPSFNARLLSFYTDETFSSSWCNMQAPEVEVLILNFRAKKYTLPRFTEMENLKALIVTNYGVGNAEIINFELLSNLEKLRRIRMEQVLIPSITLNSGQLKSLQKLSLFMCTMGQDFSHNSIQISDRLPNLEEINIGYCSNLVELPVGMCEAVKLKRLSITYCNRLSKLPKEIGKLVDLQLLRLRSCINLLGLPDTIWSFDKLNTLDIADCLSIRKLPDGIGDLRCLRKLYMNGCSKCELPKSVINLRELKHVVCDEETAKSWEPIKHRFSNLRIGE